MALFENFPYTNFHDMNLDWLLKQMRELGLTVEDLKKEIADFAPEMQEYVNEWLDAHPEATTTVLDGAISNAKIADDAIRAEKINSSLLGALDNITPSMLKYNTSEIIPGVAVQAMAYDPVRNRFLLGGPVTSTPSTAVVAAVDNLEDLTVITQSAPFAGGHCNDITYDPVNDRILVACGSEIPNTLAVLDADTLTYAGAETVACNAWVVDSDSDYIYVSDYVSVYRYSNTDMTLDTDYTYTINATAVVDNRHPAKLTKQGGFIYKEMLYLVYSVSYPLINYNSTGTSFRQGLIVGFDRTGRIAASSTWNVPNRHEVENAIVVNNVLYVLAFGPQTTGGNWNSFFWAWVDGTAPTAVVKNIYANSDLDDIKEPGCYFISAAANAATVAHMPIQTSGGSYHVMQQASAGLLGVYVSTNGHIYFRYYDEVANTWGVWREVLSATPKTITGVIADVCGYITGSTKELWLDLPAITSDKYSSITLSALSLTIRQNGNYVLGTGSGGVDVVADPAYTVTATINELGTRIKVVASSAYTNGINNAECAARIEITAALA